MQPQCRDLPSDRRATQRLSSPQAARRLLSSSSKPAPPAVGRLNHVAIAVPNLEEAAAKYRDVLGAQARRTTAEEWSGVHVGAWAGVVSDLLLPLLLSACLPTALFPLLHRLPAQVSEAQALPAHGVRVVFVELPNTRLELLEPLGDASPIARFLEKNAAGGM